MKIDKLGFPIIILVMVVVSVGCLQQNPKVGDNSDNIDKVPVETKLSRIETIYNERRFGGRIIPKEQSVAISQLQGQITKVNVEVGDEINKGDNLFTVKGISPQTGQNIYPQPRLVEEVVRASIDGIVSSINVAAGKVLSPTEPSMIIVNLNELYVQMNVTGEIINNLKKDQEAEVIVDVVSENEIKGRIVQIPPMTDLRTQLYPIMIEIANQDKLIKPGMFAEITVRTDVMENAVVIPSDTVIYRDDKAFVYVVENGVALEKEVELGLDTGELIHVVKGLEKNEEVVTKGQNFIENDTRVEAVRGDE